MLSSVTARSQHIHECFFNVGAEQRFQGKQKRNYTTRSWYNAQNGEQLLHDEAMDLRGVSRSSHLWLITCINNYNKYIPTRTAGAGGHNERKGGEDVGGNPETRRDGFQRKGCRRDTQIVVYHRGTDRVLSTVRQHNCIAKNA